MRATTAIAALLGCAAVAPSLAFTGGVGFARTAGSSSSSSRHHGGGRSRAATSAAAPGVRMMAIDPVAVHSVGDYVNAVGSAGLDHTWLSHVMHGGCVTQQGGEIRESWMVMIAHAHTHIDAANTI